MHFRIIPTLATLVYIASTGYFSFRFFLSLKRTHAFAPNQILVTFSTLSSISTVYILLFFSSTRLMVLREKANQRHYIAIVEMKITQICARYSLHFCRILKSDLDTLFETTYMRENVDNIKCIGVLC